MRKDDPLIPHDSLENQNKLESNSKKLEDLPTNLTLTDGQAIMETETDPSRFISNSKVIREPSPIKRYTLFTKKSINYFLNSTPNNFLFNFSLLEL